MGASERAHHSTGADRHAPSAGTAGGGEDRLASLSASVKAMTAPAYILDRRWNMRGWNAQAKHLFGAWLARASPNFLRFVFLDRSARRFFGGWEARAIGRG